MLASRFLVAHALAQPLPQLALALEQTTQLRILGARERGEPALHAIALGGIELRGEPANLRLQRFDRGAHRLRRGDRLAAGDASASRRVVRYLRRQRSAAPVSASWFHI